MDHVDAIDVIFHQGLNGETYNIGSNNEKNNLELIRKICSLIDKKTNLKNSENLIQFVDDRPGHDFRYAINSLKIMNQLNWKPKTNFENALEITVDWYLKKIS